MRTNIEPLTNTYPHTPTQAREHPDIHALREACGAGKQGNCFNADRRADGAHKLHAPCEYDFKVAYTFDFARGGHFLFARAARACKLHARDCKIRCKSYTIRNKYFFRLRGVATFCLCAPRRHLHVERRGVYSFVIYT